MSDDPLKPWSLAPAVTVLLVAFVLFMGGIGVAMLIATPSLDVTLGTKALTVVLVVSSVGGAISTLMWSRHSRQLDVGFWRFVSGPAPDDAEALLAWRWGRRFQLCWLVSVTVMSAIVLTETLAGHW